MYEFNSTQANIKKKWLQEIASYKKYAEEKENNGVKVEKPTNRKVCIREAFIRKKRIFNVF